MNTYLIHSLKFNDTFDGYLLNVSDGINTSRNARRILLVSEVKHEATFKAIKNGKIGEGSWIAGPAGSLIKHNS